ncbi:hypothetical protein ACVWWG_001774 [Bradyrhizobium sp. LB7.2]
MLTSNMFSGSCAATRLTSQLASPGARATIRTLRPKPPMLSASTSPRPRRPLCYAWTRSPRSRLERAQSYLKLPNGRALTGQSHDYKRHGTTTLFAALEVATGKIIAAHSKRRRRVEFLDFMNSITRPFPAESFTSSSTTSPPTRRTSTGSRPTPMCNFISRGQARPGSIRSRSGSRSCRSSHLAAPPSQASTSLRNTSMPTSTPTTTKPSPSSGPRKRSVNAVSKAAVSLSSDSEY